MRAFERYARHGDSSDKSQQVAEHRIWKLRLFVSLCAGNTTFSRAIRRRKTVDVIGLAWATAMFCAAVSDDDDAQTGEEHRKHFALQA